MALKAFAIMYKKSEKPKLQCGNLSPHFNKL
jgi:hypothetical protein